VTTTLTQTALNLVDGAWQSSASLLEVRNPADTRELLATVPSMDAQDVCAVFDAAQRATKPWRATSQVDRGRLLLRAAQLLRERRDELSRTLSLEMGKTLAEAYGEVGKAADFFEYYGGLGRAERGILLSHENPDVMAWTVPEPLGVVLAITPWNDPLLTPARKLAPALIAGNTVVLKPASDTPLIALELARVLHDAGLPRGVVNTVTGAGRTIGAALVEHPALAAVSFTGSNDVGDSLEASLVGRGIPLLAELGGKNAAVVLADADLERAATAIAANGYAFAGQSCISVQRVYVEDSAHDALIEKLVPKVEALKVGDPLDPETQVGPVIDAENRDRIGSWVDEAVAAGAKLLAGGAAGEDGLMRPTLLDEVSLDMAVACHEVFGPVVTVARISSLDEAIEKANGTEYGLQAGVFTQDISKALRAARELEFGGVTLNEAPTFRADQMPYGGVKGSGNTKEGPAYTIREMTEERLVVLQA
jgi:acyl-CoA reductase-like NAD-dependent aldehyde dehydrogenase